jgi:hypothetical protein
MLESKQGSTLSRRVVHLITQYLEPKEIFSLITKKEYDYSVLIQNEYGCRDQAMGKHPGLQAENFVVNENYITVKTLNG